MTFDSVKITFKAEVLEMRVFEAEMKPESDSDSPPRILTVRQFTFDDWNLTDDCPKSAKAAIDFVRRVGNTRRSQSRCV